MSELMNNLASVITYHGVELAAGFAIAVLLVMLVLLIVLIRRKPQEIVAGLQGDFLALGNKHEHLEKVVKDEIKLNREETRDSALQAREELGKTLRSSSDSLQQRMVDNIRMQRGQLDSFSKQLVAMAKLNEDKIEAMRRTMEIQLRALQEHNTRQLEKMRATVDEKLQTTLEKRLGESFKQVSERLEQVYKGLGEMRSLATGVGEPHRFRPRHRVIGALSPRGAGACRCRRPVARGAAPA